MKKLKEVTYFLNKMTEQNFELLIQEEISFTLKYSGTQQVQCEEREEVKVFGQIERRPTGRMLKEREKWLEGERMLEMRKGVRAMDFSNTELGDKGVELLSKSSVASTLEKVDISGMRVSEKALSVLEAASAMTALKEVVFIGNAAKEEELKKKKWRFSILFKSKDSPPLSLTVSSISSFPRPGDAGDINALGCASDSRVALGIDDGIYLADISSGVSEKIRNEIGNVLTVLRLNDSLALFGYNDGYTIYKTQPLLSSLFKDSNTGAGTCTSGCVIHVSSATDTPLIILALQQIKRRQHSRHQAIGREH
jgi:hypothetical protein